MKKVFISYAKEDLTTAEKIYNDLKKAGVSAWLDRENIQPGQNWKQVIRKAISESAFFLALLSSTSLSKKGFVQKELKIALDLLDNFPPSEIFIIPVRLEECRPVETKLRGIHWVDLFSSYETGLNQILSVLRPHDKITDSYVQDSQNKYQFQKKHPPGFKLVHSLKGHNKPVNNIAWSPDGRKIASASRDNTLRIWDLKAEKCLIKYRHFSEVYRIAWSPDGNRIAFCSPSLTIFILDSDNGKLIQEFEGHTSKVRSIAWSTDGQRLASGSSDNTARLWNTETGQECNKLKQHTDVICSVSWSPDGNLIATGSYDKTICIWDSETGELCLEIKGHTEAVNSLVWSPDGAILASGSRDRTIRIWEPKTGRPIYTLAGHTGNVSALCFIFEGRLLMSKSNDGSVGMWFSDKWNCKLIRRIDKPVPPEFSLMGLAYHSKSGRLATLDDMGRTIRIWELDAGILLGGEPAIPLTRYINAKMVLLGSNDKDKKELAACIAGKEHSAEIHSVQVWQVQEPEDSLKVEGMSDIRAELSIWNLPEYPEKPEYRFVNQLFLNDVDVALLIIDSANLTDDSVHYWSEILRKHAPSHILKFLISTSENVKLSESDQDKINNIVAKYNLFRHFHISLKKKEHIDEFKKLLHDYIPWKKLPHTSTLDVFNMIHEFILEYIEKQTLITIDEISHGVSDQQIEYADIETAVNLLQARGFICRLQPKPGLVSILLKPYLIYKFALSVIEMALNNQNGSVPERDITHLTHLPIVSSEKLKPEEEWILIGSTIELLIRNNLCYCEMGMLFFPGQIKIAPSSNRVKVLTDVSYHLSGSDEAIYASLVVRLNYTDYFKIKKLWKYSTEFLCKENRLGFDIQKRDNENVRLEIYFHENVSDTDRFIFIQFITDHLRSKKITIKEQIIHLYCTECKNEVTNRRGIKKYLEAGKSEIPCQYCPDTLVKIWRSVEERYGIERSYDEKQDEFSETVKTRTNQETQKFWKEHHENNKKEVKDKMIRILHLSDIHLCTPEEALKYRIQLEADLKKRLNIDRLEYLVISGDIAMSSVSEEYESAYKFVSELAGRFNLNSDRVIIAPGNHDLNWELSGGSYSFVLREKLPDPLTDEYILFNDKGALKRNDTLYQKRFIYFSEFYKKVCSHPEYPPDFSKQGILHKRPDDRLLFLTLNSCWKIDHHYLDRSGINVTALSHALDKVSDRKYDDWLKIAVFHHPIFGPEAMKNIEFTEQLVTHGFKVIMHGHIHEAIEGYHKYDDKRGMHCIGSGTFGAPAKDQIPGIPLQYNLLELSPDHDTITVRTRKKDKPDGAWSADPRWGDKEYPKPSYEINLKQS